MKKFSLMLFLFLSFLLCSIFPNTVHADNQDSVLYDIQIEYLKNSNDANELNSYRKEFLKYLNQQVKLYREATGKKTYSYLTYSDLDFNDSSKVYGLKYHGAYTEYELNASYKSFTKSLDEDYNWKISIDKDGTTFNIVIYKTDDSNTYGDKIGGGWYVHSCYINDFTIPYNNPTIIEKNMRRMLNDSNEKRSEIKMVFVELDRLLGVDVAVVFVDNKAKYIYAYGMDFPIYKLSADTPQEVYDVIMETIDEICSNCENQDTKTKRLYSYNMIMAFYKLCEYYNE